MGKRLTFEIEIAGRKVRLGERTLVMGVVNVTPDSFSDGGLYLEPDRAVAHGVELRRQGADWIDVGGESSRPGAKPISAEEELARVLPVVRGLRKQLRGVPISIDTPKRPSPLGRPSSMTSAACALIPPSRTWPAASTRRSS